MTAFKMKYLCSGSSIIETVTLVSGTVIDDGIGGTMTINVPISYGITSGTTEDAPISKVYISEDPENGAGYGYTKQTSTGFYVHPMLGMTNLGAEPDPHYEDGIAIINGALKQCVAGVWSVPSVIPAYLFDSAFTYAYVVNTGFYGAYNGSKFFSADHVTNGVNYIRTLDAVAGSAPSISATGNETNINLLLSGQGAGTINMCSSVDMKAKALKNINGIADGTVVKHTNANGLEACTNLTDVSYVPYSIGTTKGDMIAYTASNTPVRVAVGVDGQFLTASGSSTSGVCWSNAPLASTTVSGYLSTTDFSAFSGSRIPYSMGTTKGSLIGFSAASTPLRVPSGTEGQVLTMLSGQTAGIGWQTPSAGGGVPSLQTSIYPNSRAGDFAWNSTDDYLEYSLKSTGTKNCYLYPVVPSGTTNFVVYGYLGVEGINATIYLSGCVEQHNLNSTDGWNAGMSSGISFYDSDGMGNGGDYIMTLNYTSNISTTKYRIRMAYHSSNTTAAYQVDVRGMRTT